MPKKFDMQRYDYDRCLRRSDYASQSDTIENNQTL